MKPFKPDIDLGWYKYTRRLSKSGSAVFIINVLQYGISRSNNSTIHSNINHKIYTTWISQISYSLNF